jgi:hypothetical protein
MSVISSSATVARIALVSLAAPARPVTQPAVPADRQSNSGWGAAESFRFAAPSQAASPISVLPQTSSDGPSARDVGAVRDQARGQAATVRAEIAHLETKLKDAHDGPSRLKLQSELEQRLARLTQLDATISRIDDLAEMPSSAAPSDRTSGGTITEQQLVRVQAQLQDKLAAAQDRVADLTQELTDLQQRIGITSDPGTKAALQQQANQALAKLLGAKTEVTGLQNGLANVAALIAQGQSD